MNEKADEIHIIVEGRVRIINIGTDGEEIVLSTLERGQVFGKSHVADELEQPMKMTR